MMLQNPLALIGLVLIPLIIILRLWQTRPVKIFVSSIFIWRRLSETSLKTQNRSVRKIVLVTLILILAVSALVLGLAQPALETTKMVSRPVIILLDNSVGMTSVVGDRDQTRWQYAMGELKAFLKDLPGFTPVTLMVGAQGIASVYRDQTPRGVSQLIELLTPFEVPSGMENLVFQAAGIINSYTRESSEEALIPQVYICSDRMLDKELLKLLSIEPVFILVGEPSRNAAITHAAVLRSEKANSINILVRTNNFSTATLNDIPLEVYAYDPDNEAEPNLITKTTVTLLAGVQQTFILGNIDLPGRASGTSSSVVKIRLDIKDDLTCDNRVWLSLSPSRKLKAVLIGKSAPGIQRALQVQPNLEVEYLPIDAPRVSATALYDLYIFKQCLPAACLPVRQGQAGLSVSEQLPPEAKVVLVDPPADFYPMSIKGGLDNPALDFIDIDAPLLSYVDLSEIHIWRSSQIEIDTDMQDSFHAFVSSDQNPLIGEWYQDRQHFIVIGFNPDWHGVKSQTDWALSISFPIFWTNLVNHLLDKEPSARTGRDYVFYYSGELVRPNLRMLFDADQLAQTKELTLLLPDGSDQSFEPSSFAFIPEQVGIYRIKTKEQTHFFTVNLCNNQASDNNGVTQSYQSPNVAHQKATMPIKHINSLTKWFVLAGLVLLMLTWFLERYA